MKIYSIGFTKKSAEVFFSIIEDNKIKKVIDIRLNNSSQLTGFSKGVDLKYFLKKILNVDYEHIPLLAPSKEILNKYKKEMIDWNSYEKLYFELIKSRNLSVLSEPELFDHTCFLCSEELPNKCHRRLIAEYIRDENPEKKVEIIHL